MEENLTDLLELTVRVNEEPKPEVMRQAAHQLLSEACEAREVAARGGEHPPVLATWYIRSKKDELGLFDHSHPVTRNLIEGQGTWFFSLEEERKTPSDKQNRCVQYALQEAREMRGKRPSFEGSWTNGDDSLAHVYQLRRDPVPSV